MIKKSKIVLLDEINCIVNGLDAITTNTLYDKFGIYANNYFFNPKFKLKRWDGKIRFFSKIGKTYINLLDDIIPILNESGYKIILDDKRKINNIKIPNIKNETFSSFLGPNGNPLILGDHQVNAINAATENNNGIILASTGSGKTIITAILALLYNEYCNFRTLVIVPTVDLVVQTKPVLSNFGNDVGEYTGDLKDIDHDVVVSTWQALQNNKAITGQFQVIIMDEGHKVKADVVKDILNNHCNNAPVKFGLTGTLPKSDIDQLSLRISLGNVIYKIPAAELIKTGWLSKAYIKILKLKENFQTEWQDFQINYPIDASKINYKKFKDHFLPDYPNEKAYLKKNVVRRNFISKLIIKERDNRGNTLVLVSGIDYGKKLAELIPNSYFVYGADAKEYRREIYDSFQKNDNIILITSFQIASTGIDITRLFNLFLVDSGNTFENIIQSIGRSLRKGGDKFEAFIFDVCSDLHYSKDHLKERKKFYKEEGYEFTEKEIDYMVLDDIED